MVEQPSRQTEGIRGYENLRKKFLIPYLARGDDGSSCLMLKEIRGAKVILSFDLAKLRLEVSRVLIGFSINACSTLEIYEI